MLLNLAPVACCFLGFMKISGRHFSQETSPESVETALTVVALFFPVSGTRALLTMALPPWVMEVSVWWVVWQLRPLRSCTTTSIPLQVRVTTHTTGMVTSHVVETLEEESLPQRSQITMTGPTWRISVPKTAHKQLRMLLLNSAMKSELLSKWTLVFVAPARLLVMPYQSSLTFIEWILLPLIVKIGQIILPLHGSI